MEFRIRRAEAEDAGAIARVHVESWKSTYAGIIPGGFLDSLSVDARTESWREQIPASDCIAFVCEDGCGIFGFVCGGKLRKAIAGYDAELFAIYLLRERQGQGAGRKLVEELEGALRGEGLGSIAVWVLAQNPATGFYRHLGGIEIAQTTIEIGGVQLAELAFGWALRKDSSFD